MILNNQIGYRNNKLREVQLQINKRVWFKEGDSCFIGYIEDFDLGSVSLKVNGDPNKVYRLPIREQGSRWGIYPVNCDYLNEYG